MKISELRELSPEELVQKLGAFKKELLDLRMKASFGKLEKSHQMRIVRRDVARILTLLKQKKSIETT